MLCLMGMGVIFSEDQQGVYRIVVCCRIALQEETNRMSANALAIVFAPCILRCPDSIDPLQSVQDISKTTAYVLWPLPIPQIHGPSHQKVLLTKIKQRCFMDQMSVHTMHFNRDDPFYILISIFIKISAIMTIVTE